MRATFGRSVIALFLALLSGEVSQGCSVLSHEAIVDALWDVKMKPVLLARYPQATREELKKAHGYAYGGAIIQDLGYYPHGSKHFSDLTHYVRTGDFVTALIAESQDLNELAFALGALTHYSSDIEVHRSATNPGEAILYPKLRHRYGPIVTYEKDPAAHLKTEFGFDVLEVARGNFAPEAYHDFIGFFVADGVLQRAFRDTYGIEISDIFDNFQHALGSYRHAVSNTIPKATRVAWAQRENEIEQAEPGITRKRFVYVMKRSSYERSWGRDYDRPSPGERFIAVFLKLIPPIGPLRALRFRMPTPEVEKLFMQAFARSVGQLSTRMTETQQSRLRLADINYDVGENAKPGTYGLEDETYCWWLDSLANKKYAGVSAEIRENVLAYYHDLNAPYRTKKNEKAWSRLLSELQGLKQQQAGAPVATSASAR